MCTDRPLIRPTETVSRKREREREKSGSNELGDHVRGDAMLTNGLWVNKESNMRSADETLKITEQQIMSSTPKIKHANGI